MKIKKYTTIQIYKSDLNAVVKECRKDENLRDKLHDIIREWKRKQLTTKQEDLIHEAYDDRK